MEVSRAGGFLLDRWGWRGEKGDMSFLRALGVTAIVATTASLGLACGDDGVEASGLSGGSAPMTEPGTSTGAGSSSTGALTSSETTDTPTVASTTAAESSSGEGSSTSTSTSTSDTSSSSDGSSTGNATTNGAACGNGAIDGMEQCDGANLNGFTCEALGNAGGTLQCDPVTCTFDTQLCEGGGGTSG